MYFCVFSENRKSNTLKNVCRANDCRKIGAGGVIQGYSGVYSFVIIVRCMGSLFFFVFKNI